MPFILRPMKPSDVPVVSAIDRLAFPTPWPAAAFRRELQRERAVYRVLLKPEQKTSSTSSEAGWLRRLFKPMDDSRIIGYVGFRFQGSEAHITTIAVHPDWRARGLGELLLLVALGKMQACGVDAVTLEMRPSNQVAYRLYRKYGFRVVQLRRNYYQDGEDAWVMAVKLDDRSHQQRVTELREALKDRLDRQNIEVGQIAGDAL